MAQVESSIEGCERALEFEIHESIKQYYTSFWFPPLCARSIHGELELIGIWNSEDLENLQANFIGHILQQRRLHLKPTFFFALTLPESEHCLSIDNTTGAVLLEEAGKAPERIIADSLVSFLDAIEPVVE